MAKSKIDAPLIRKFQKTVLDFYKKKGRHALPWRTTTNSYRILVSEVMLQQTQVDRVIPYYKKFLKKFPTIATLADAPLREVLVVWQGLGYNRRAKMLHEAAKTAMINHSGQLPKTYEELVALPGVGDYTAKAVRVFAYNEPEVLIETNVRSVFIYHFFPKKKTVSDKELLKYVELTLPKKHDSREWYAALMDYGSYIKKEYPNPSRRSKHHIKQKPFKGSNREIRGAILRAKLQGEPISKLPFDKENIQKQTNALVAEGLLKKKGKHYVLSD